VTAAALALWLAVDLAERSSALSDLVGSGDLVLVETEDGTTIVRPHGRSITRFECDLPILPPAAA
jgi:hypothetical protein